MGLQLDRLYAQALERGPEQSCPSSYRCWLVLRQHSNRTRTDWDASLAENGARRAGPEEGPKKRSGGRKRSWSGRMAISWPDSVDEILVGDDVVMLGYLTPATGVVLTPVTNFAVRDRRAGTFTVNSSIGAWKKLERIRRRRELAIAFHTRSHGHSTRPEYVLLQGRATLSDRIPDYPATIPEHWEPVERWRDLHPLWKR